MKKFVLAISSTFVLFSCGIAVAQERFFPVPGSNNMLVDSKDIFIQDHINPALRVARVVSVNNEGEISNVLMTFVNCQDNTSGVSLIANGRGEIVYMAGDKMEMAEQPPGTQAYEMIRTICELPARSGSVTSQKIKAEPRWIAVPCTAASKKTTDLLHIDQDSILKIRNALNFDVVDAKKNSYHAIAICTPSDRRYGQIAFTAMNGVNSSTKLSKPKPGSKEANLFKFVCSKYGYLKHGESYRSAR